MPYLAAYLSSCLQRASALWIDTMTVPERPLYSSTATK